MTKFVSVYVEGGLINRVQVFDDLERAIGSMRDALRDSFDPGTDDARIFKTVPGEVYAEEVHSYNPEEDG